MKTIIMPQVGRSMAEGKILRWLKHEGELVQQGESLAEVETDKASIEVDALATGVLRKILAAQGQTVPVGVAIALIGAADEPLPAFAMEQER